jgi:tRNA(His) guanylyltransferase
MHWPRFFQTGAAADVELQYPPQFDARCVLYPSLQNLRDYISWRQADCHINNLYTTTFWALVLRAGLSETEAERQLAVG